jgi:TonB-linked SusC/RagA family outer membrane protein
MLLLLILSIPFQAVFAADTPISGVVSDENGQGLPGVNVLVKGTAVGATTDARGRYSLRVPAGRTTLVFSFVGYVTQEVELGGRSVIDLTLRPDEQSLNEVVVIGYGEQSRKTLSTAISKVDGRNLSLQPVSTPGEALAALASGVQVQSDRGGYPGAAPVIRIRGIGSLGTSGTPLYVVDGYPLQEATQFNLINPADIESIEILKDAASAAIYGSRAANGVVIVTTKRGKVGKTNFTVSTYTGIQRISKKIDMLGRDEFIENMKFIARVRNQSYPAIFDTDPTGLPDTDWQDAIFRQAPISDFQLAATGGSERIRYAVSGGYFRQVGTMKGTDFSRYNLRLNLDADLTRTLRIGVSLAPSFARQSRQPAGGQYQNAGSAEAEGARSVPSPIHSATVLAPVMPLYNKDGDYGQVLDAPLFPNGSVWLPSNHYNPLGVLEQYQNYLRSYRLLGTGFLEWEPLRSLRLKTSVGSTLNIDDQNAYIPATLANDQAPRATRTNPVFSQIFAREAQTLTIDWLWENTATYSRTFAKHHTLTVLGLYTLQKFQAKSTATTGRAGTFTTDLLENPLASPDRVGELSYDRNAFLSYGGRISYDYRSKYILSAALRRDASSRFGPNNRFATFPSVSGAWRVSEESFWSSLKPVLSELKIRASYGETGNASIGSFTWQNSVTGRNYSFGGQRAFGYNQSGFANFDLTWEKNRQTDLGLEAGLLNDRFSLSVDLYNRLTDGMLFQKDLPGIVGYATNFRTNLGRLQNRGIEISAKAALNLGQLSWTIDGNLSANQNKVLDLGGPTSLPPQGSIFGWGNVFQVRVGDPLGNMYGYQVQGIYKSTDDLTQYPQWATGNRVGDWIIKDQNGDNKIDESDRVVIGQGFPKFIYGMTHTLQFKNFDLTLILQGVQGTSIVNGNLRHLWSNYNFNIIPLYYNTLFDPANPDRPAIFPAPGAGGVNPANNLTDRTLFDGSFLRVRNLTLGYTLPTNLLKRLRLQTARVYLTGQNLLTFTNYIWYNPETSLNGGTATTPGVDQGTYPANRTVTAGLSISF